MKLLIPIILLLNLPLHAADVNLAWDLPTNNVDGTVLTDLAGVCIYYGTEPGNHTERVEVGLTNECTVSGLSTGVVYYFTGTAYNVLRNESAFCNEVVWSYIVIPMPLFNFRLRIVLGPDGQPVVIILGPESPDNPQPP